MDVSGRCRKRGHAEGGDWGGFEWLQIARAPRLAAGVFSG